MRDIDTESLLRLIERQKVSWSTAAENYDALSKVVSKRIVLPGCTVTAMHNPARILSTASKSGETSRDCGCCFLCTEKRPAEQEAVPFAGRYSVLVNPYPIFERHFTIAALSHTEQRIDGRFGDMLQLAVLLKGFTVFYNGAACGASAPHHAHFQAGESGVMPIEWEWQSCAAVVLDNGTGRIFRLSGAMRNAFVIESGNNGFVETAFDAILKCVKHGEETGEPGMNLLAQFVGGTWRVFVFLRKAHRPSFYGTGDNEMLVSPASVEMGGLLVLPRREDFDRIDDRIVTRLYDEVCIDGTNADAIVSKLKSNAIWASLK